MRRLLLLLGFCLSAFAQTHIVDTLRSGSGALANGSVTITPSTSWAISGGGVVPSQTISTIRNGVLDVRLYFNPVATSYRVAYNLRGTGAFVETWVVPDTTNVITVANVRQDTLSYSITLAQLAAGTAVQSQCPIFNATSGHWEPGSCGGGGGGSVVLSGTNGIVVSPNPITGTGQISGIAAAADGTTVGVSTFAAADFNSSAGLVSIDYANGQKATASVPGFLTAADFTTFNNKQAAGSYATLNNTNTFTGQQDASGAASTRPMKSGTTLPATCSVGETFFKTDATAGQNIYECASTNTWTQQLNSGAGGASQALDNLSSLNINSSLLAQAGVDLGSTAKPFRNVDFYGSGTYGSTYFRLGGTPTGTRDITFPDASGTVLYNSRAVNTSSPITGGGALSGDLTLACATCGLTGSPLSQFAATTSAQLASVLSDESGTGAVCFTINCVMTTPNVGTPSAITLTNATGMRQAQLADFTVTRTSSTRIDVAAGYSSNIGSVPACNLTVSAGAGTGYVRFYANVDATIHVYSLGGLTIADFGGTCTFDPSSVASQNAGNYAIWLVHVTTATFDSIDAASDQRFPSYIDAISATGSTGLLVTATGPQSVNVTCNTAAADGTTPGCPGFIAADFNAAAGIISLDYTNGQKATDSVPGFLSAADHATFNGKGTVSSVGLVGTANQITVSGTSPITTTGTFTLSIPTNPTLPGTTTGTFSGNLTGNVTGNASGTAATITGLLTSSNIAKQDVMDVSSNCADAGSTDAYACNLSPAITAYTTGIHYRFKANTANTGAATINFNAVGAKTIVKLAGAITTTLADNDIRAGQWVELVYDGTNMQMESQIGNAAGTGTVTVSGGGNLGGTQCVTGAGTQVVQTPSANCTVDSSGNLVANSLSAGSAPAISGSGILGMTESTGQACAASADCLVADSASHALLLCNNNGTCLPVVRGPTSAVTSGHVATFNGTSGLILQDGGALPTGTVTSSGSPAIHQLAVFTTGTDIKGVAVCGTDNPVVGVASNDPVCSKVTLTNPATGATLTLADNKTFTVNNTLTITATDGITMTTPTTSFTAARTDAAQTFTGTQSFGAITATGTFTNNGSYAGSAIVGAAQGGTSFASYTKGDTICPSGSTTLTKLAVGSDAQVLTADAASTCGIKWAAAGGGSSSTCGRATVPGIAGDWDGYPGGLASNKYGAANVGANVVLFSRFHLDCAVTVNNVVFYLADVSGGTCNMEVGVYNDAGTTLLFHSGKLTQATTVTCNGSAGVRVLNSGTSPAAVGMGTTIGPGDYIAAFTADDTASRWAAAIVETFVSDQMNGVNGNIGTAAASSGGVLNSTIGTLTSVAVYKPQLWLVP